MNFKNIEKVLFVSELLVIFCSFLLIIILFSFSMTSIDSSDCVSSPTDEVLVVPPEVLARQKFGSPFRAPVVKRRRTEESSESTSPKQCCFNPELAFRAIALKPELGTKLSEGTISDTLPLELKRMAGILYNHKLPYMIDKASDAVNCVSIDFAKFQEKYVVRMDKSALRLCEQKFHSISDAQLVLCQMIRSYVPNMSAILYRTRERSFGSTTIFLCSAYRKKMNPKTSDKEEGESQACSWRATLTWNSAENVYFFFKYTIF